MHEIISKYYGMYNINIGILVMLMMMLCSNELTEIEMSLNEITNQSENHGIEKRRKNHTHSIKRIKIEHSQQHVNQESMGVELALS